LYYSSSRRRRVVAVDRHLRAQVNETMIAVRAMLTQGGLPGPTTDVRRCKNCSLRDRCQPEAVALLLDPVAKRQFLEPTD